MMKQPPDERVETPIRRQYLDIKRRYPHAIVFFRLGDFYETFDEDALLCARELEIALTSRPVGKGQRVPLAGIPYHALNSYLGKLISKGYKVAICEQVSDPSAGRGLVQREVVRVVTPGTVLEENLLDQQTNNYLAALAIEDGIAGLAYVDITTGEFATTQFPAEAAQAELDRLRPAELLVPKGQVAPDGFTAITGVDFELFDQRQAAEMLLGHFAAESLEAFGCHSLPLATAAAGAVVSYLQENQRAVLPNVSRLSTYNTQAYMALDAQTRRNLELFAEIREGKRDGSLLGILDLTRTAMGARQLKQWLGQPLLSVEGIGQRQDKVTFFHASAIRRGRIATVLGRMPDVERLLGRINAGVASPRDLLALRNGLQALPEMRSFLLDGDESIGVELSASLPDQTEILALFAAAIAEEPPSTLDQGGVIRASFSSELDGFRSLAGDAKTYLLDLERRERDRTGIKNLKVGYNKVFGYYIEVSKANAHLAPDDYHRFQTLVGGERFTTPELKEYEFKILHAEEQLRELEASLFRQVCAQVAAESSKVLAAARALAEIDVFASLAEAAARYGYVRPEVNDGEEIVVSEGRHPVVERMLPPGAFVPNDAQLANSDVQVLVITGPNMAGKSTYLRQVALIALLAQVGSFVPARSATIGVVDHIFTRIGAVDDIAAGRSTFMVEMVETAAILHNATPRSLLIFDEIGRGTSTYDGLAIAQAVVEFLHNRPEAAAKTLFATHYHELVGLAAVLPRVRNFNVAVVEEADEITFAHRILPGGADKSYGVHVAELAGLPRAVTQRAREVLADLEAARGKPARQPRTTAPGPQLPLFERSPLLGELAALEVDTLTPLEALTKLYELRQRARGEDG